MKKYLYLLVAVVFMVGLVDTSYAITKKGVKKKAVSAQVAASTTTAKTLAVPAQVQTPSSAVTPQAAEGSKVLIVYLDSDSKDNHFAPTGWMGDYGDIKIKSEWSENPHSGKTCIKITYTGEMKQNAGWGGIYWQYPNGNWGQNKKGGMNLTGAKALTFWAKGDKGGEILSEFKMGGITGEFGDTDSRSIGPVTLTNNWEKYTINLVGADISNIIGGFCWAASKDDNPNGFTIYLDDIQYEY